MTGQELLSKWEMLDQDEQQQVLALIDSLHRQKQSTPAPKLGTKLRQIRQEIIDSGLPLLTAEQVEQEKAERRSGYQGDVK